MRTCGWLVTVISTFTACRNPPPPAPPHTILEFTVELPADADQPAARRQVVEQVRTRLADTDVDLSIEETTDGLRVTIPGTWEVNARNVIDRVERQPVTASWVDLDAPVMGRLAQLAAADPTDGVDVDELWLTDAAGVDVGAPTVVAANRDRLQAWCDKAARQAADARVPADRRLVLERLDVKVPATRWQAYVVETPAVVTAESFATVTRRPGRDWKEHAREVGLTPPGATRLAAEARLHPRPVLAIEIDGVVNNTAMVPAGPNPTLAVRAFGHATIPPATALEAHLTPAVRLVRRITSPPEGAPAP